jgi:DNA mismatch repair ATPase MutS
MSFLNILFADEKVYTQWYDMPKSRYDNINRDINLDKIAEHISANRPDFPTQFLLYPCADKTTALMRIEVFRELYEKESVCIDLSEITKLLSRLGKCKASESNSGCVEQKWMYFLKTAEIYIECIQKLSDILSALKAGAFRKFYSLLQVIQDSTEFQRMVADTNRLSETFSSILNLSLSVDYNSKSIIVTEHIANSLYEELQALCEDILGLTMYRTFSVVNSNPLSALEEDIIKVLKRRHSDAFKELAEFYEHYSGINVYDIVNLKNQIIFYIEFIEFVKKAEAAGMKLTLPDFTDKAFEGKGLYDLSLALKIPEVIPNDFCFGKGELFVLSGPNQGGKTTLSEDLRKASYLRRTAALYLRNIQDSLF